MRGGAGLVRGHTEELRGGEALPHPVRQTLVHLRPAGLLERVDEAEVIKDAKTAGLQLMNRTTQLPFQYLLVFGK